SPSTRRGRSLSTRVASEAVTHVVAVLNRAGKRREHVEAGQMSCLDVRSAHERRLFLRQDERGRAKAIGQTVAAECSAWHARDRSDCEPPDWSMPRVHPTAEC